MDQLVGYHNNLFFFTYLQTRSKDQVIRIVRGVGTKFGCWKEREYWESEIVTEEGNQIRCASDEMRNPKKDIDPT